MNEFLFFFEIILVFGCVVFAEKLWGENGLIAWCAIAPIIANMQTAKLVSVFGVETMLGTTMFASCFLSTDILTEKYGEGKAKKAVFVGLFSVLIYLAATQFLIAFIPSVNDVMSEHMKQLFEIAPRVCFASVLMFFLSNLADVKIFSSIRRKMGGKKMWIRNNVSTVICNCLENFLFCLLAFGGVFEWAVVFEIAISTSIFETIIAICDTPFLYWAVHGKRKEGTWETKKKAVDQKRS